MPKYKEKKPSLLSRIGTSLIHRIHHATAPAHEQSVKVERPHRPAPPPQIKPSHFIGGAIHHHAHPATMGGRPISEVLHTKPHPSLSKHPFVLGTNARGDHQHYRGGIKPPSNPHAHPIMGTIHSAKPSVSE